jgi:23S rRNA (cytosine1962-C5)-methyltransferase
MSTTDLQRLSTAIRRRRPLAERADTSCYRVLHRAFDGYPDLAVDKYGEVLVANLYATAREAAPISTLQELQRLTDATAVYVKRRPRQASRLKEAERADLAPSLPLLGTPVDNMVVLENGARLHIHPGAGLSVGLFLDMREQRAWVRAQAAQKSVLNCFAYTCAFGIAAQLGGAHEVVNLDISRQFLEWGRRNAQLNGLPVDPTDYVFGDVFDWLGRFARSGRRFDLVILDPPSFSTTKHRLFSVDRDYASLVELAVSVTTPGGAILACANSTELTAAAFKARIRAGLDGRRARLIDHGHEPDLDFPVASGAQPYLKICLAQLLDEAR